MENMPSQEISPEEWAEKLRFLKEYSDSAPLDEDEIQARMDQGATREEAISIIESRLAD